jgi:alkanesulfonate monooxygenase SsuD/methylene tetrahydromethanopterin reductase-like flavin-dependent oxidoreductase (luciferase family)
MDFGLLIHPTARGGTLEQMRATNDHFLRAATEHKLTIWVNDHFHMGAMPWLECLTFVAHITARYPTLTCGTVVLGQGYRNPALTAKIASTLDFLTEGRFILGIGAGWKEDEYRAYGFPYPSARERVEQLDEALRIIKAMWEPGTTTFEGKHYHVAGAINEPRPPKRPLIMIGGGGERRTLRVVAEHADWWNADYYTPEDYARKLAVLRGYCAELGRDPATIVPTYFGGGNITRNPERAIQKLPVPLGRPEYLLSGNPDEVSAKIERLAEVGVRHTILNFLDFPGIESIELFLNEVLPRFR